MRAILLLSSLGLVGISHASLIINGGFENPVVFAPGGVVAYPGGSTGITGWTVTGSDVVLINNTHTEAGPLVFNSQELFQHVDVTGAGNTGFSNGIFQNVPTTIGQIYNLSYWIGRANGASNDPRYQTQSTVFLGVGGMLVASSTNADIGTTGTINWKSFSHSFTATTTSTQIGFFNGTPDLAGGGNNFAGVDNVSMEAVPEPTTIFAMGAGLVALMKKRKKA